MSAAIQSLTEILESGSGFGVVEFSGEPESGTEQKDGQLVEEHPAGERVDFRSGTKAFDFVDHLLGTGDRGDQLVEFSPKCLLAGTLLGLTVGLLITHRREPNPVGEAVA